MSFKFFRIGFNFVQNLGVCKVQNYVHCVVQKANNKFTIGTKKYSLFVHIKKILDTILYNSKLVSLSESSEAETFVPILEILLQLYPHLIPTTNIAKHDTNIGPKCGAIVPR